MGPVTRSLKEPSPCRAEEYADGKEEDAVGVIVNEKRLKKNRNRVR